MFRLRLQSSIQPYIMFLLSKRPHRFLLLPNMKSDSRSSFSIIFYSRSGFEKNRSILMPESTAALLARCHLCCITTATALHAVHHCTLAQCQPMLKGSKIFAILIQSSCVMQSDAKPIVQSSCLIQPGLYPKNLFKHLTAVFNTVWLSISDPEEFFRNPVRSDSGSELQNPIGSRSGNRITFNTGTHWIWHGPRPVTKGPLRCFRPAFIIFCPHLEKCVGKQRWARTRTGSDLMRTETTFAGSGLDRTEKIFVVLMWLFWKYKQI